MLLFWHLPFPGTFHHMVSASQPTQDLFPCTLGKQIPFFSSLSLEKVDSFFVHFSVVLELVSQLSNCIFLILT